MTDRGQKIVQLAREMLHTDFVAETSSVTNPTKQNVPVTALCLTAMLAALGSSVGTTLVQELNRPVSRYEKIELKALVFYAARVTNIDEAEIQRTALNKFELTSLDDMTVTEFAQVRDYLRQQAQ